MTPNETILKCLMEGGLKFNAENEIILIILKVAIIINLIFFNNFFRFSSNYGQNT